MPPLAAQRHPEPSSAGARTGALTSTGGTRRGVRAARVPVPAPTAVGRALTDVG